MGFPQCLHIPILPAVDNVKEYYNRKGFYSIVVQDLINHQYHVTVGWPGSVHDAQILSNLGIFDKGESGTLTANFVWTFG